MEMMKIPPLGKLGQAMGRMGRMRDNTLVHMNPQEVQGLAALGKLTYNPVTGLPEAFSFSEVIEEAVQEKETSRGKQYFVDLVEKIHETFVDPQPTGLAGAVPSSMPMPAEPPIPPMPQRPPMPMPQQPPMPVPQQPPMSMPKPPMPQGMAGGGYVGGEGHGMEDNQMFKINGGGLAALSPKEYVVPADVMSGLGNGNPDDGAEKMDDFISDFRKEKYGRDQQPPEMDGRKTLENLA